MLSRQPSGRFIAGVIPLAEVIIAGGWPADCKYAGLIAGSVTVAEAPNYWRTCAMRRDGQPGDIENGRDITGYCPE